MNECEWVMTVNFWVWLITVTKDWNFFLFNFIVEKNFSVILIRLTCQLHQCFKNRHVCTGDTDILTDEDFFFFDFYEMNIISFSIYFDILNYALFTAGCWYTIDCNNIYIYYRYVYYIYLCFDLCKYLKSQL